MAVLVTTVKMGKDTSGQRPIHPLFQPQSAQPIKPTTTTEIQLPASPTSTTSTTQLKNAHDSSTRHASHSTNQHPTGMFPESISPAGLERGTSPKSRLEDMNEDRRKQRRTDSPTSEGASPQSVKEQPSEEPRRSARASGKDKVYTFAPNDGLSTRDRKDNSQVGAEGGRPDEKGMKVSDSTDFGNDTNVDPVLTSTTTNGQIRDRQKKLLLFNPKTGTIGSPPAKKPPSEEKQIKAKQKTSHLVTISYSDEKMFSKEVGSRIEQILSSPPKPNLTPKKRRGRPNVKDTPKQIPPIKLTKSPLKPGKALHPLFAGKPKTAEKVVPSSQMPPKAPTKPNIISLTTPKRPASLPSQAQKAPFAGFGPSTKITKTGGALHPAWPWKDAVHVRGESTTQTNVEDQHEYDYHKAKFTSTVVADQENVLQCLSTELDVRQILETVNGLDMDSWSSPPPWLRLPTKHLKSGHWLQSRLRQELRYGCVSGQAASLTPIWKDSNKEEHPALDGVFNLIATTLSAFDTGGSENRTWTHKYSPRTAADVLQIGQEASLLHGWLKSHVVTSVEGGIDRSKVDRGLPNSSKRKRKAKKADDFIVSDDESDDEISENEEDFGVNRTSTICSTVVRSASKTSRLKNAVLISGPSGCGKSAMVHAVAKELGFEVFEINPGSRRSGKDILEKVGDMARNHLVHRQHNTIIPTVSSASDVDEDERIDQALADEIASGRQGTMGSFFTGKEKPKSKPRPIAVKKTGSSKAEKVSTLRDMPLFKPAKKIQKQSLILLEEVDILYEEDKTFWMTVLGLIISSRRPIIMTCNNEAAVQADLDEHLHAILRLTAPPVDLAADYLLLVAAAEGHLLGRASVKKLYESRSYDLRASIDELNFWCQFGIGDQKHGGDWYYRRQDGHDLDVDGHPVRVVSEGSYSSGLEWISSDLQAACTTSSNAFEIREEVLEELWDRFGMDPSDSFPTSQANAWANTRSISNEDSLTLLQRYEHFTDAMSSSDLCARGTFASDNQIEYDPSHPLLPTKALDDFPLGSHVLQTPIVQHYHPLAKHISIAISARSCDSIKSSLQSTKSQTDDLICKHISRDSEFMSRRDLCLAFDPISFCPVTTSLTTTPSGGSSLDPSVFDRTTSIITTDVAPYVRGIVKFEAQLQQTRLERSGLLSQNSGKPKKARMTRSAMSAVEGGARGTTRREKWFDVQLNNAWVSRTGGAWGGAVAEEEGRRRDVAIKALQHSQALAQARMEKLNKQEIESVDESGVSSQVTDE